MIVHVPPETIALQDLPLGDKCCDVSLINTTTEMTIPSHTLIEPVIAGHERLNLPTYAFHIKNRTSGIQVMFDLGARPDWQSLAPSVVESINQSVPGLKITKAVDEILQDAGVDLRQIKALVLSHWHWDHIGDPSKFPDQAELVVGPGFKDAFMPGYPAQKDGLMLETDFKGRNVNEIEFSDAPKIGDFRAHDYFGDGSFYILDMPGHATGHISALVRDTPSTFVLLGGDAAHFGGVLRPTHRTPFPSTIPSSVNLDSTIPRPCPCSVFIGAHPRLVPDETEEARRTTPFYEPASSAASWFVDPSAARTSIEGLAKFDASSNVLVLLAHDTGLEQYLPSFPQTLNGWKSVATVKDAISWHWVNELPKDGKCGRLPLVDGKYQYGKKISEL